MTIAVTSPVAAQPQRPSLLKRWWLAILASLAGIAWLARGVGPEVWWGGLVSILGAVAYTAGPVRLGYLGLGDAMVMFFFGFVELGGHHYVQTGYISNGRPASVRHGRRARHRNPGYQQPARPRERRQSW